MPIKDWIWSSEDKTVRGSFVNISITIIYVILIIVGSIFEKVASNLSQMSTYLIGFFAVSWGVYSGKKIIENISDITTATDAVNNTLQKLGIKVVTPQGKTGAQS